MFALKPELWRKCIKRTFCQARASLDATTASGYSRATSLTDGCWRFGTRLLRILPLHVSELFTIGSTSTVDQNGWSGVLMVCNMVFPLPVKPSLIALFVSAVKALVTGC